ncbi:hypothetical protein H5410_031327 [Solanum commersonii]|uniref:DUF1985 domain-containing protein n=1 Tax=Solanum commersonii TaxID=4109 RepID=A0A9J5YIU2_SOLCO|nr:hypothetical protein H5410_031327 [Solanum commersonii]
MKYVIKTIPTHALRFEAAYNTEFVNEIKKFIGNDDIELFKNTIFGSYLNIPKCNFQGQITKCMLLLELQQDNTKLLHIRQANGSVLQFSIKDFSIITGLRCKGNVKDFTYPESTPSRLLQRYFLDATISLIKNHFVQCFLMGNWETTEDGIQMAILYFVHTFIFYQLGETSIPVDEFLMNACSNIIPTPNKVAALDLCDIQVAHPPGPSTSAVDPNEVEPKDIPVF